MLTQAAPRNGSINRPPSFRCTARLLIVGRQLPVCAACRIAAPVASSGDSDSLGVVAGALAGSPSSSVAQWILGILGAAALPGEAAVRSSRSRRWALVVRVDRGLGADAGCRGACEIGVELGFAVRPGVGFGAVARPVVIGSRWRR